MDYTLIRSRRKTISLEIDESAHLLVRAPLRAPKYEIENFINEKGSWIEKHIREVLDRNDKKKEIGALSPAEIARLKEDALRVIPDKVSRYADILGVTYGRITIRCQKTLWGSCSRKGNLNFNCILMKAPERVLDYVIVHELCHRIQMNHSRRFWELVEGVVPDHKECRRWLRREGSLYLG